MLDHVEKIFADMKPMMKNLFITRSRIVQPLFWILATTMCAPKGCRTA